MGEIRITIDGEVVTIHANMSKKELLNILEKAKLNVKLSIEQEAEDSFTGTRWKNINEMSMLYHQTLTIQKLENNVVYYKYDIDDTLQHCTIDELTSFARMLDE